MTQNEIAVWVHRRFAANPESARRVKFASIASVLNWKNTPDAILSNAQLSAASTVAAELQIIAETFSEVAA